MLQSDRLEARKPVEKDTPSEPPQVEPEKSWLAVRLPSYRPLPWSFLNTLLDNVDMLTRGRAGWLQRFCTYIVIGGMAAVVNLIVFYVVFYRISLPVHTTMHNIIANVLAAEISIMANFIPNDFFTFRYLPGHERSWGARCLRFHITALGGVILTLLIEFGLHYGVHVPAIVAQAVALILALIYNFSFHHIFTYRHAKVKPA